MSNLALWSRPAWDTDRWLRDFFGPAAASDWFKPVTSGFTPAAEIVKDGDDAVVRLELPGVDVEKDVNVEVDRGRLVIHGEHRDEHAEEKEGRTLREIRYGSFRPLVPTAAQRHGRGHHGFVRRGRADGPGCRCLEGPGRTPGAAHRDHQVVTPRIRRSPNGFAGFFARASMQAASRTSASGPAAPWPGGPGRPAGMARS